jgi:hypothetical protein
MFAEVLILEEYTEVADEAKGAVLARALSLTHP